MKKSLLVVAALLVAGFAQAQDNKMWLSGTAMFSSSTNDPSDAKSSSWEFGPAFGYMINENIAVGLGLSIGGDTEESTIYVDLDGDGFPETSVDVEIKTSTFGVAPFLRYYKSLGDNVSMYGELEIGFASGKIDSGAPDDLKFSSFGVGVAPGIQYWFHDNWSVNAEWGLLGFNSSTVKDGAIDSDGDVVDDKTSTLDIGLDLSALSFGLNFHF